MPLKKILFQLLSPFEEFTRREVELMERDIERLKLKNKILYFLATNKPIEVLVSF